MLRVGMVGWRGMVGSVLLERMRQEHDFQAIEPMFFSTSRAGGPAPSESSHPALKDARSLAELGACDAIVSCQGGEYTSEVYGPLRKSGWKGYWIDAASTLRMADEAIIILDPVNREVIEQGLVDGLKTFAGGNCTVSLMLMAVAPLFKQGLVEWMTSMTYQAASGAGAAKMLELVRQMSLLTEPHRESPTDNALEADRALLELQRSPRFPTTELGAPLAGSLLPWIDKEMPGGQSKEEWKGIAETNKILGLNPTVPVDGICVRVGAMRCHSQALTFKLKSDLTVDEIESMLAEAHPWVQVIANTKELSIRCLTPTAVSGTLHVAVGRIHKLNMGPDYLSAFTVGDQLLWGAAEPLRRMLRILLEHLKA
jgi:aspartate-semialdehyde dehydrogenase